MESEHHIEFQLSARHLQRPASSTTLNQKIHTLTDSSILLRLCPPCRKYVRLACTAACALSLVTKHILIIWIYQDPNLFPSSFDVRHNPRLLLL